MSTFAYQLETGIYSTKFIKLLIDADIAYNFIDFGLTTRITINREFKKTVDIFYNEVQKLQLYKSKNAFKQ